MANKIVWYEVVGTDGSKLQRFYADMFGWKYRQEPCMDYAMTDPQDTGIGGGIGTVPGGASWAGFYVGVDDVENALRKAEQLGGKVVVPTTKLPDVTFAVFSDPEGHMIGLAQEAG
jgi:predicted enzyme related to lactoylglutathione lyase